MNVSALCLLFAASLAQQRLWTGTSPCTLQLLHVHYTRNIDINEVVDIIARNLARRLTVVDIYSRRKTLIEMATRRLLVTDIHDTRLMYIAELVNPRDVQLKLLNGAKGSSRDIAPLNSTLQA